MSASVKEFLENGPATSKEIQAGTNLSQRAVSRQVQNMGSSAIKIKRGRTYYYMVTCNAFGGNDSLPLVMVDMNGSTDIVAFIRPLAHGGFFVSEVQGMSPLLLGENRDGLYDDLPYFLADSAPQGFIGRQIAAEMASQSEGFPADPRRWNSNHIGCYLMSNGDDLPGNLKFGNQALFRRRRRPTSTTRDEYPRLADAVMKGEVGGSSAGGEQPKFTAYCSERSAHVIVKFSPKSNNDVSRRWRDILITEYHASHVLLSHELSAAKTDLFEKDGRLFLESIRFDRSGEHGRGSMISLQSIDAEFVGSGGSWPQVIDGFFDKGIIGHFHYYDAKILWLFGRLINNTDMHLGNLSMAIDGNVFRLLPVYDMCSMGFSPKSSGEVTPFVFTLPAVKLEGLNDDKISRAENAARDFWGKVASDERISKEFKAYLVSENPMGAVE